MINLIRVQLISLFNLNGLKDRKKRLKTLAPLVIFVVCLSPTYIGFIALINKAYRFAGNYQLPQDLMLTGMYSISQMMVLVLGVPMLFSTLLRSKDLSILLPLPYTPVQILASKLSVAYLFELGITLLCILPVFVLNVIYTHPGVGTVINGALSILLLPMIPLAVCAILTLLIASIPGIGRNKWFWQLIIMACVLSLVFSINSISFTQGPQAMDMIKLKMEQMSRTAKMVPGSIFGVRALVSSGFNGLLNQVLNIAVAALYVGLLFMIAGRLYIKPILQGDGIRRAKGRRGAANFKARGFLTSYIGKELATCLKDPAVAMNGLGVYMMIPVLAITYTIMKVQSKGQVDIIGSFSKVAGYSHTPELMPMLAVGFALVLVFLGTSSSLFSSTYSKDGKRLWIEKSLPVDPFTVFVAKLLTYMFLISILNAITALVFNWILHLEFTLLLYAFVLSEIMIACNGVIGMLIDCRRPKLEWKDTVQAVKQNMNVLMSLAGTMLVIALNILILYMCHKYSVSASGTYVVVMAVNIILLGAVLASARKLSQGLNEVVV